MMECTVEAKALARELTLARGVVEAKATIPILGNVLMEARGDVLTLTASDLDTFLRTSISAKVKTPGSVTLPAARLLDYVRLLDGDVAVTEQKNNWIGLAQGRSRARMAGMPAASFPECPESSGDPLVTLPFEDLSRQIARVAFAIATEESRFTLNGAMFQLTKDRLRMVATDGHRLALTDTPIGSAAPAKFLVPRKALKQVEKLAHVEGSGEVEICRSSEVEINRGGQGLFFKSLSRSYYTRELTGNFPDYERVLPVKHPLRLEVNRGELAGVIDRVRQFSDERTRCVRCSVGGGELKLSATVSDVGESEEALAVETEGEPFEIGFNSEYMIEFLKAGDSERVAFLLKDGQAAGELRPCGEDEARYRYVLMPMRT